jgi:glycosyltransferase involved in cell wall biosynthesis
VATRPGVALVIPVLDEGETIGHVVRAVPGEIIDEVIVVDGGSRDDTVARAKEAGARVVVEPRSGYGAACLAGARSAAPGSQVIAFMDGDGSDDPAELARMVAPIAAGEQDFVIGSRLRGEHEAGSLGLHQALAGRLAGFATRLLYGVRYTDMCPLRAIRRDALEALAMKERTYGWNLEMQMRAARAGLRILELPVRHRNRAGGASKVSGNLQGSLRAAWRITLTLARVALQVRSHSPRPPRRRA